MAGVYFTCEVFWEAERVDSTVSAEPRSQASSRRVYFHLQVAAARLAAIANERCLAAVGVTAAQAGAMFVIAESPGATQKHLADTLRQRESAVSGMVGRLLSAGLIERQPSERDRRARELSLTEKGRTALDMIQHPLNELNAVIDDALGPERTRILVESLEALTNMDRP